MPPLKKKKMQKGARQGKSRLIVYVNLGLFLVSLVTLVLLSFQR
jgi:hypothetical protein